MHINSNNTHTHTPLFIYSSAVPLCVCAMLLARVCKTLPICTIFCSLSCFALRHLPAHWVSGAFSFGWLDVCFAACIGCSVQHICIYTLILMPHFVLDIHTSYIIIIILLLLLFYQSALLETACFVCTLAKRLVYKI